MPITGFHGSSSYLRHALLIERVVVADLVEVGLRRVVRDAQQEQPADARILRSSGNQGAVGLQLPQVGPVRLLVHDDFFQRAAIADNSNGIHDDPYSRHGRYFRQGI